VAVVASERERSSSPPDHNLARLRRAGELNTVNVESVRAALNSKLRTQNSKLTTFPPSL
jgi:hypothetical protein